QLPVPGQNLPAAEEKNPEWTVCQVRMAADALVRSWQLPEEACERLLAKTARRIRYYQQRHAVARASHTRTASAKLQRQGITVSTLPRCYQDTRYRCSINTTAPCVKLGNAAA
ncbi:MAG: hypothetical protein K6T86_21540, partial [Pirellulales bacterium]|nr:hypothetical protein [Pirellulales bacterium]